MKETHCIFVHLTLVVTYTWFILYHIFYSYMLLGSSRLDTPENNSIIERVRRRFLRFAGPSDGISLTQRDYNLDITYTI